MWVNRCILFLRCLSWDLLVQPNVFWIPPMETQTSESLNEGESWSSEDEKNNQPREKKTTNRGEKSQGRTDPMYPSEAGPPWTFLKQSVSQVFGRKLILKLCPLYFLRRTRRRNIKSQLKNEEETFLVWLLKWLSEKKFPVKMTTPGVQQALHRELPWLSWFFKQWQKEERTGKLKLSCERIQHECKGFM